MEGSGFKPRPQVRNLFLLGRIVVMRGQLCDLALPADAEATLRLVAFSGPTRIGRLRSCGPRLPNLTEAVTNGGPMLDNLVPARYGTGPGLRGI
jgi:hypothetical protein